MEDFKVPFAPKVAEEAVPENTEENQKPTNIPQSPYTEPSWGVKPDDSYSFEVLKNGKIIETHKDLEKKSFWSFGRLPQVNDIELAHPTISRFHAVLQFRGGQPESDNEDEASKKPGSGWYLYDLGSTHGSFVNKQRVPAKTYVRLRVGYMFKMGASTRTFILLGPNSDEEEVKAESITEMKEQKEKAIEEMRLKREQEKQELEEKLRAKEEEGISWGMADDAEDEPDLSVNPFSVTTNEELFLDDPKKTLRGFFEREGLELEYKTEDLPGNTFQCRIELPLDDENGRPIHAQVTHKGKKKECVVQCALEACRILDKHGVLRKANQEAAVRRKKADSDSENDDDFLDRTGDIERRRKRKAQQENSSVLTHEELLEQEKELQGKIRELEERISASKSTQKKKGDEESEDLDDFMSNLKSSKEKVDKVEIKKLRVEQQGLQKDLKQVQRLIGITKPLELPKIKVAEEDKEEIVDQKKTKVEVKAEEVFERPQGSQSKTEEPRERNREVEIRKEDREKEEKPLKRKLEVPQTNSEESLHPPPPKTIPNDPEESAEAVAKKKARQRVRHRKQVRDNVDMEETAEEVEEKFTDWLPPSNQSGDGTTSLNAKLGY